MAIVSMADAVSGAVASSSEYNKLIDNIQDLDARLGAVVAASTAHARLNTLETRTTHATTGNTALGTRVSALESGSTVPGAWVTVTGWKTNWGDRTGFPLLSVRSLPGDNVQILGTAYGPSATRTAGSIAVTLPVGYRPTGTAAIFGMDGNNNLVAGEVQSNGDLQLKVPLTMWSGTGSSGSWSTWTASNTIIWNHIYYVGTGVANA